MIKTQSIKIKDIQQLIIRIDDKAEELIDHFLEKDGIEPGEELNKLLVRDIKQKEVLKIIYNVDDEFNAAEMYILIRAIDEKIAEEFLPLVKAVTHQCMMLKDAFPHCDLEERYLECMNILMTRSDQHDSDLTYVKADCVTELTTLRNVWCETGIASKWDQIKEFPKVPVVQLQDQQLKALRRAERAHEQIRQKRAEILDIQEKIKTGEKAKKERAIKVEEATKLLRTVKASIGVAEPLDGDGAHAYSSGSETPGPTSSGKSIPQYREPPGYPGQHQAASKRDETRISQVPAQYGATSELLEEAVPLTAPASALSGADGSVTDKSKGAITKRSKKEQQHSARSATSVQNITEITSQASFIKRLVEKCEKEHDDCISRENDLRECIGNPTEKNKRKALEAISHGFWRAKFLDVHLAKAGWNLKVGDNPFLQKHRQLCEEGAFKYGLSPWVDKARNIPYFIRQTDEQNNTSFTLSQGYLASKAIQSCRDQLFIADFYCFFQTILYELIQETLDLNIFDGYFSEVSRLRLTPAGVASELAFTNPVLKILMPLQGEGGKHKLGLIKTLRNAQYEYDDAYITQYNILYAICTNPSKELYTVPGIVGSASTDTIADCVTLNSPPKAHHAMRRGTVLKHEFTYRCEWSRVMQIRKEFVKAEAAKRGSLEHEPVQTERRRHRRKKEEADTSPGTEQPPSAAFQVSTVALYQETPKEFELNVNKAREKLIQSTKAHKKKSTPENKKRLVEDITELEKRVENLDITSELDDDTRKRLKRQTDAALTGARTERDKKKNIP